MSGEGEPAPGPVAERAAEADEAVAVATVLPREEEKESVVKW